MSEKRAALVTGGARRVGRAIVQALSQAGFGVAIHCSSSLEEANLLRDDINASGGNACVVQGDLAAESDVRTIIPTAAALLHVPISCLVNCASTFTPDDHSTENRDIWDNHMQVNLRSPMVLGQELLKQLPPLAEGQIVNILDQRVFNLSPLFASYTVSKTALWTLTQSSAIALAPRIRVNAVAPGPVLPSVRQSQEVFDEQCSHLPLQRNVKKEDIAAAVLFLLNCSSMTGQCITVDCGESMGFVHPGASMSQE